MEYVILILEGIIAIFIIVVVFRTLYDLTRKYLIGLVKKDPEQQLHNYQIVRRMLRGVTLFPRFLDSCRYFKNSNGSLAKPTLVFYSCSSD